MLPLMLGVLLLINLINPLLKEYYPQIFRGNFFIDPFLGAITGSISFGIPVVSYILGGEFLKEGISLLAVTAFILAWSTVGIAMLPLEIKYMGKRFAFVRNGINFIFAILIAIVTVSILRLF